MFAFIKTYFNRLNDFLIDKRVGLYLCIIVMIINLWNSTFKTTNECVETYYFYIDCIEEAQTIIDLHNEN